MGKIDNQKEIQVDQVVQKILDNLVFEQDLTLEPEHVKDLYISNIVQRVFARMVGQSPSGPRTVRLTEDGSLAVVQRGGAFDDYERIDHFFSAANVSVEKTFTRQISRIDIFTYDGKVDYQLTRDLIKAYGPKINLFEDSFYSLDFFTRKVNCTSKTYKPRSSGTTDATTAGKLVDSTADFVSDGVTIGDVIANTTDDTETTVTAIDNLTTLSVSPDIFTTGEDYVINGTRLTLIGWFREGG
jgi:hypothetical protein